MRRSARSRLGNLGAIWRATWRHSHRNPPRLVAREQWTPSRAYPPRTSIQFDVGVLDHLSPVGELRLDEVAQFFGRRGKSLEAYILELCLGLRAVDDLAQGAVELGHDLRRRAGGCDQARPGVEIEALDAGLVHGRQVGEQRATPDARHC